MELKSVKSTKQIVNLFKSVTDAVVLNKVTGETIVLHQQQTDEIKELWINLS